MKVIKFIKRVFKIKEKPGDKNKSHGLEYGSKIALSNDCKANRETPNNSYKIAGELVNVSQFCELIFLEEVNNKIFFIVKNNAFYSPYNYAEDNSVIYFQTNNFLNIKYKIK